MMLPVIDALTSSMCRLAAHLALVLVLAGCALGPDYRRAAVPAPEGWRDGQPGF